LFTPPTGWDDNDRIQAVVYGELPDGCYTIGDTTVESVGDHELLVRQYANKAQDDACIHGNTLPPHLLVPITFTQVVEIGTLAVGDYKLFYSQSTSGMASRVFNVKQASTSTVDELPYANVTQQYSEDILDSGKDLVVTLKGVLNSTCVELDPNVKILREGDVYVLLPVVKIKKPATSVCGQVMLPFETQVHIGPQTPGLYLVHIRSQGGNAVNHVVRVIP
jgi:hypothetical protein